MGRVKSFALGKAKILKETIQKIGYVSYTLTGGKTAYAHTLVLEAFVGERPKGSECRHLNGIKTDNRLDNLKWGTRSENQMDRFKHGTELVGEKHYAAKLEEREVLEILQKYSNGGKIFHLAEEYGVARPTISHIVKGETWKHLTTEGAK